MIDSTAPATFEPATHLGQLKVWNLALRIFHWLLVGTILLAFVSAEEGASLGQWHVAAGAAGGHRD